MSRFILIDHSLKGVGGHHFEYATHVLEAARRRGFEVILAANRRFRPDGPALPGCAVYPIFRYTTYSDATLYHSSRSGDTSSLARRASGWIRGLSRPWNRAARIRGFYSGLCRLFRHVPLESGDQVFIPTLSELDLLGLSQFLASDERARRADWHLQFHYNIFDGREPDFAAQKDRLDAMRSVFAAAWDRLRGHRMTCYNTTAQLTAQYDRLGVTKFRTLPYPVNPAFHEPRAPRAAGGPLRVTSAGAIRAEKGCADLADVLRQGWPDLFATGRVQLVVQSNKSWFKLPLPGPVQGALEPVLYAPHPLDPRAYVELLRHADIGLLLYDSDRYYSRCSGVLVEMLSMGVPVIVSAGCWMADQIAPAIQRHIRRLVATLPTVSREPIQNAMAAIDVPGGSSELVLTTQWDAGASAGIYARFDVECQNETGKPIHRSAMTVGRRAGDNESSIMAHVASGTRKIQIFWRNAYHDAPLPATNVEARFLGASHAGDGSHPLGAVGLIAADVSQVGDLLRDMVRHWPHYRDTAAEFASSWRAFHHANRIVSILTDATHDATLTTASRAA
jgi:hypothetical protein